MTILTPTVPRLPLKRGHFLRAKGKQPQSEPRSTQARDSPIDRRGFGKYPGNSRPAPLQARIRLMESLSYGSNSTISPSLNRGRPWASIGYPEAGAVKAASPHRRLFCSVPVHLVNSVFCNPSCGFSLNYQVRFTIDRPKLRDAPSITVHT